MKPTPEQAQKLFSKGMISPEQFNRLKAVPGYDDGGLVQSPNAGYAQGAQQTITGNADAVAPDSVPATFVPIVPPTAQDAPYSVGAGVFNMPTQNVSAPVQDNTPIPIPNALDKPLGPDLKLASDVQITRPGDNANANPFNPNLPAGVGTPLSIYNAQTKQIQDAMKGGSGAGAVGQESVKAIQALDNAQQAQNALTASRKAQEDQQALDFQNKLKVDATDIANSKVDTDRFWNNTSTAGKIAAGIGLFLGSFGAGPNRAVDVINNSIRQDIDAQKADIENKKSGFAANKGIYGEMVNLFKDRGLADLATQAQYQQHAQNQIAMAQAKYAGSGEGAKMQQLADELAIKQQETAMGFNQRAQQMATLSGLSSGNTNVNPLLLDKDTAAKFVPGYGVTYSADDAKDMKELLAESNAAASSIDTLKQYSNLGSKVTPGDKDRAAAAVDSLIGASRRVLYGGKANTTELESLKELIQNPANLTAVPYQVQARLTGLQNEFNSKIASHAKAIGLQTPAQKAGIQPLQNATATKP